MADPKWAARDLRRFALVFNVVKCNCSLSAKRASFYGVNPSKLGWNGRCTVPKRSQVLGTCNCEKVHVC